jgi:hypothetical protein
VSGIRGKSTDDNATASAPETTAANRPRLLSAHMLVDEVRLRLKIQQLRPSQLQIVNLVQNDDHLVRHATLTQRLYRSLGLIERHIVIVARLNDEHWPRPPSRAHPWNDQHPAAAYT